MRSPENHRFNGARRHRGRDSQRLGLRPSPGTSNLSHVSKPSKRTSRNLIPLGPLIWGDGIGIVGRGPAGGTASNKGIESIGIYKVYTRKRVRDAGLWNGGPVKR